MLSTGGAGVCVKTSSAPFKRAWIWAMSRKHPRVFNYPAEFCSLFLKDFHSRR